MRDLLIIFITLLLILIVVSTFGGAIRYRETFIPQNSKIQIPNSNVVSARDAGLVKARPPMPAAIVKQTIPQNQNKNKNKKERFVNGPTNSKQYTMVAKFEDGTLFQSK